MLLYLLKEMLMKLKMLQSLPHKVLQKSKEKNPKPPRVQKYFLKFIYIYVFLVVDVFIPQ